jgi:pimeloyl-ACP methyl ester carboxylesterase
MTIAGRYVQVGGTKTYIEEAGEGTPIVMLPSAGRDTRMWHGVMEALEDEFRSIAIDLPGHGKSWPLPGPRCITEAGEACEFIDGLLDAVGARQVVMAGFSLGGNLSLMYGATRADRCLALIAMEASDYSPTHTSEALALLQHPRVSAPHYMLGQVTTLLGRAASPEIRQFNEWYGHQIAGVNVRADLGIYSTADSRDLMGRITCPVLMMRGEHDWIVPADRVDAAASHLTGSRYVRSETLDGIGHFPPLEAPGLVASQISAFLREAGR